MRSKKFIGVIGLLVFLVSGCAANPYQVIETREAPKSGLTDGVGIIVKQRTDTTFKIEIYGALGTSRDDMRAMAYTRASEIALENGFQYFYITYALDMEKIKTHAMTGVRLDSATEPVLKMIIGLHSAPTLENEDGRTMFLANAQETMIKYKAN